jgi:hypothetical protein
MGGLEEQEATEARERLGALKRELGYVSVDEPVGAVATIAHVERAPVPVRLHVMPGSYPLHVESGGRSADQEVRVGAGEVVNIRVPLPPPQPATTAKPLLLPPPARKEQPPSHASRGPSPWAWVAIGGGVALSGLAVFLGVRALDEKDRFNGSGNTNAGAHDNAAAYRTWTNVAWGGAALSGGTGIVLLFTTPKIEM